MRVCAGGKLRSRFGLASGCLHHATRATPAAAPHQPPPQVFYDLKRLLEESKAQVPPELARSEAAKQKPGAISQKRDQVQYAKK